MSFHCLFTGRLAQLAKFLCPHVSETNSRQKDELFQFLQVCIVSGDAFSSPTWSPLMSFEYEVKDSGSCSPFRPFNEPQKEVLLGPQRKGTLRGGVLAYGEQLGPRWDASRLIKDTLLPVPVAVPCKGEKWQTG